MVTMLVTTLETCSQIFKKELVKETNKRGENVFDVNTSSVIFYDDLVDFYKGLFDAKTLYKIQDI